MIHVGSRHLLAANRPWRDFTEDLPVELLSDILELLPQPDVVSAAGVARRWRSVATTLHNYYRHHSCNFVVGLGFEPDCGDTQALPRVVHEAETGSYNLSLCIDIGMNGAAHDHVDSADIIHVLFPCLRRAAPRLIALSLSVAALHAHTLDALSTPAPVLRRLGLAIQTSSSPSSVAFPAFMFRGGTPRLTAVSLQNLSFLDAARTFSGVDTLTVASADHDVQTSLWNLHLCFQTVRHLAIEGLPRVRPLPAEYDIFRGLESLIIGESVSLRPLAHAFDILAAIPSLDFRHREATGFFARFVHAAGPVKLVLAEHVRNDSAITDSAAGRVGQLRATLLSATPGYRRTIDCDIPHGQTIELLASLDLVHRLTYVSVDDRQIRTLMRILGTLPALHTLSIILVRWATVSDTWDNPAWERALSCHCGKDGCACSGPRGYFADGVDDAWPSAPGRNSPPLYPSLHTLKLSSTRMHSSVPTDMLWDLSCAFAPGAKLHLELCNGLEVATELSFVRTLFASVRIDPPAYFGDFQAFDPHAEAVQRASLLRKRGAERKEALRDSNGGFTVFRYYDFDL